MSRYLQRAEHTARLLDVPLLSPVLLVTGVTFDASGRVIDLAQIQYRGDRFRFRVSFDVPARERPAHRG